MNTRWLLPLFAMLCLSSTQAQSYFGVGASVVNLFIPLPSVQVGGPVAERVELRITLDSVLVINDLGLDVLYTFPIPDAPLKGYVGGGPDVVWVLIAGGRPFLAAHATAGLEYLTDNLGIYGELQPLLPVLGTEGTPVFLKLRAGVNFYF